MISNVKNAIENWGLDIVLIILVVAIFFVMFESELLSATVYLILSIADLAILRKITR